MHLVLKEKMQNCDVLVMTAAVADAKPATSAPEKIKKKEYKSIDLVANEDILADLSSSAKDSQVIVGFAAETSNIEESGHEKLKAKDLDLIYVNDVSDGAIFASDLSTGYLITSDGKSTHIEETSKAKVARIILDNVVSRLSYANG
jgi:phosphopantothenoylcysteine decarboxylase/phosphopantothenate--cysteine ligase